MRRTLPLLLAAGLLTGCAGNLWGLPVPPERQQQFPRPLVSTAPAPTQLATARQGELTPASPPAEVPAPGALLGAASLWCWSRRMRRRSRHLGPIVTDCDDAAT
jgi:hypothetical protein